VVARPSALRSFSSRSLSRLLELANPIEVFSSGTLVVTAALGPLGASVLLRASLDWWPQMAESDPGRPRIQLGSGLDCQCRRGHQNRGSGRRRFNVFPETGRRIDLTMSGQYLYPYERRGFPWRVFEIRETAHSHFFFGLKRVATG